MNRALTCLVAISALFAASSALAQAVAPSVKPASEPQKPAQLAQGLPSLPSKAGGQSAGAGGQTVIMGEERELPWAAIAVVGSVAAVFIVANEGGGGSSTQH